MAVLVHCWCLIELYLIPDGMIKWFFLSFYIHPFFLVFCQIVLWIKTLERWIFFIIFLVNQYVFSHVLRTVRHFLCSFLVRTRSSSAFGGNNTEAEDEEDQWHEVTDSFLSSNTTSGILFLRYQSSSETAKIALCDGHFELIDQETVLSVCSTSDFAVCSSSDFDDESITFSGPTSPISYSIHGREDVDVISSTPSSTCTSLEDQEDANNDETDYGLTEFLTPLLVDKPDEEEKDSFYRSYTERMSWFDLLYQERTCGLNAVVGKKEYTGGEKRIVQSLESDFEMVYVAQSCLSWEALHYQYRKLESIIAACTSAYGALCSSALVNKFQRFQILVKRFMEDERTEKGKRYWNFVQKRSTLNSLLQVPDISENVDVCKEGSDAGLMIRSTDVLKAIEKCMKTFKAFIETDEKRPWWRAHSRLSQNPSPLEDPRDFNFLHSLTRTLRQKELWMKDMKGKQRCWLRRRVRVMEDVEKKEMMFAMTELKLVSRVLTMPVISTSQLQWCQQKLDQIEISNGRITRSSCTGSLLFPPS